MNYNLLADLLIPEIDKTPDYYINMYPKRDLNPDALVTRYAPSPTGFQHIGSVFASLIALKLARQSDGIFYIRTEDTDRKREVAGAIEDTIRTLKYFGIDFDEGMISEDSEKGNYGPYRQSERMEIYKTFIKDLIRKGLAYPCFCNEDELNITRRKQQELKVNTGYYGKWAACRNLDFNDIESKISQGKPYIIRLKSPGNSDKKIIFKDLMRGDISMPENDQDIVIMKSDGLPTYHFAHAVDDHLMGTTLVTRGEEWLPSLPIHIQLFEVLGFNAPKYVHIPTIMKIDGSSKRKLSKRKDPEVSIEYYSSEGYPFTAVTDYLINIINSNFEDWRNENPHKPSTEFKIELNKMNKAGALFDIAKLTDISKDVIAKMDCDMVYDLYIDWAKKYDTQIADLLEENKTYAKAFFNIDRGTEKPRKDFGKWSDVKENINYFYDSLYNKNISSGYNFPDHMPLENVKEILSRYIEVYNHSDNKDAWFSKVRELSEDLGYAKNNRVYKKNPDLYKGTVADVASVIRIALTNKKNTPDLYEIMQILGEKRVIGRLNLMNN